MTVSERIRFRLRDEMEERGLSQDDIATLFTRKTGRVWSQPKVGKYLTGRVAFKIPVLELFCEFLGLTLVELVRDHGKEFLAEMTPTELMLLQKLRRKPWMMDAVMVIMEMGKPREPGPALTPIDLPPKPKRGRPLNSASTQKQKEEWPAPAPKPPRRRLAKGKVPGVQNGTVSRDKKS